VGSWEGWALWGPVEPGAGEEGVSEEVGVFKEQQTSVAESLDPQLWSSYFL
jgi:hypothetical protein